LSEKSPNLGAASLAALFFVCVFCRVFGYA